MFSGDFCFIYFVFDKVLLQTTKWNECDKHSFVQLPFQCSTLCCKIQIECVFHLFFYVKFLVSKIKIHLFLFGDKLPFQFLFRWRSIQKAELLTEIVIAEFLCYKSVIGDKYWVNNFDKIEIDKSQFISRIIFWLCRWRCFHVVFNMITIYLHITITVNHNLCLTFFIVMHK